MARDTPGSMPTTGHLPAAAGSEQLQRAFNSGILIEQAKGVPAERHDLPPREAFERLRRHARNTNRKLRDVCHELMEGELDLWAASGRRDRSDHATTTPSAGPAQRQDAPRGPDGAPAGRHKRRLHGTAGAIVRNDRSTTLSSGDRHDCVEEFRHSGDSPGATVHEPVQRVRLGGRSRRSP
jgi:hypothetical protein